MSESRLILPGNQVTLFPDQQELVERVRQAMGLHRNVLLQSPTGSGKTQMATHIIQGVIERARCPIFTVPRKDLLEQTSRTFTKLGIEHSFIAADHEYRAGAPAYLGMVDTMARRLDRLPASGLLINDEVQHGDKALASVINHYKAAGTRTLGLSATPWKLSGKGLGCFYDTMVQGKSISWLIANKRLSAFRYFRGPRNLDLSKLRVTAGDYNKADRASFMEEQTVIYGDCVADYRKRSMGRLHIVRSASIKASQMMADRFRQAGIPAVHVDGETPVEERKRIFVAFAMRQILVLCFVDLLNMGFDLSQASGMDVCIEGASDMSPSKSLAGQMQFWGRALRMKEQPAIINDHVNNYLENGKPDDERVWTLADRTKAQAAAERAIPTSMCPNCFSIHRPQPVCPECGHTHVVKTKLLREVGGELEELNSAEQKPMTAEELVAMRKSIQKMAMDAMKKNKHMPRAQAIAWATKKITASLRRDHGRII